MRWVVLSVLILHFCTGVFAQAGLEQMLETDHAFRRTATESGMKAAFLEFLADDSIIFRPEAVNGREFWKTREEPTPGLLVRYPNYTDIASNGLLGYTTGRWEFYRKGQTGTPAEFGEYVTIWEKKPDGKFRASVDIATTHEEFDWARKKDTLVRTARGKDLNKRGWSPVDASMDFFRMGMSRPGLGGAYRRFAIDDVRILREGAPPIIGKKRVVSEMRYYVAIEFPKKIALSQSADMAYVWNPCEYANNDEGMRKGNCLHIWKLRNKKWWIVLGVVAPFSVETPPKLKSRQTNQASQ